MPLITFIGTVDNAEGAVVLMSINGPNHFSFSKKYSDEFKEPLALDSGQYFISISVFTDGDFTFDVNGSFTSINPKVPDDYAKKNAQAYTLNV
jgi:hypothetical protein